MNSSIALVSGSGVEGVAERELDREKLLLRRPINEVGLERGGDTFFFGFSVLGNPPGKAILNSLVNFELALDITNEGGR